MVNYFVQDQLPIVVPVILFIALLHIVVQRFFDRRESGDNAAQQMQTLTATDEADAPIAWLFLPMLRCWY